MSESSVPAAVTQRGYEGHCFAWVLGKHRHGAAERRLPNGAGGAGTAVHHHLADELRREITGGVMRPIILVAERNAVIGDIVGVVVEATHREMLGLAQSWTIGLHIGDARRNIGDGGEIG